MARALALKGSLPQLKATTQGMYGGLETAKTPGTFLTLTLSKRN